MASSAWVALGAAEAASSRIAEAESAFRRALALFPGSADAKLWIERLQQAPRQAR